jgi:hypothetical protein
MPIIHHFKVHLVRVCGVSSGCERVRACVVACMCTPLFNQTANATAAAKEGMLHHTQHHATDLQDANGEKSRLNLVKT